MVGLWLLHDEDYTYVVKEFILGWISLDFVSVLANGCVMWNL